MKICDFDKQFLSDSYLLRFAQNSAKICHSQDPDLYDDEKGYVHSPSDNAQWHAKVGLLFLIHLVQYKFYFQWRSQRR